MYVYFGVDYFTIVVLRSSWSREFYPEFVALPQHKVFRPVYGKVVRRERVN